MKVACVTVLQLLLHIPQLICLNPEEERPLLGIRGSKPVQSLASLLTQQKKVPQQVMGFVT